MAEYLTSPALAEVPHAFSTRVPLPLDAVLPGAMVASVRQVHGAKAVTATQAFEDMGLEADAIVTDRRGVLLSIVTADCAPVLLADGQAGVVGAAHAGWRGALAGILEHTLELMIEHGARRERMVAAIGPAIAQASYEVDAALRERFPAAAERYFAPGRAGHWQFDLPGYVAGRLHAAGVGKVDTLAADTYADEARFHSYRRASHRDGETTGRQTSVIGLP